MNLPNPIKRVISADKFQKFFSAFSNNEPTLTKAITPTCLKMCPEDEILQRSESNKISFFECAILVRKNWESKPAKKADSNLMIKAFRRSDAGRQMTSETIRPVPILLKTTFHLMLNVLPYEAISFKEKALFITDRLRAVRQELIILHENTENYVEIFEKSCRFHILAMHELCENNLDNYDSGLNGQYLNSAMCSLIALYTDSPFRYPNEAEFRCYDILLNANYWSPSKFKNLPSKLKNSPSIQLGISIFNCIKKGDFEKFFRLFRTRCNFFQACCAHQYLPSMRFELLKSRLQNRNDRVSIEDIQRDGAFNDKNEVIEFVTEIGLNLITEKHFDQSHHYYKPSDQFNQISFNPFSLIFAKKNSEEPSFIAWGEEDFKEGNFKVKTRQKPNAFWPNERKSTVVLEKMEAKNNFGILIYSDTICNTLNAFNNFLNSEPMFPETLKMKISDFNFNETKKVNKFASFSKNNSNNFNKSFSKAQKAQNPQNNLKAQNNSKALNNLKAQNQSNFLDSNSKIKHDQKLSKSQKINSAYAYFNNEKNASKFIQKFPKFEQKIDKKNEKKEEKLKIDNISTNVNILKKFTNKTPSKTDLNYHAKKPIKRRFIEIADKVLESNLLPSKKFFYENKVKLENSPKNELQFDKKPFKKIENLTEKTINFEPPNKTINFKAKIKEKNINLTKLREIKLEKILKKSKKIKETFYAEIAAKIWEQTNLNSSKIANLPLIFFEEKTKINENNQILKKLIKFLIPKKQNIKNDEISINIFHPRKISKLFIFSNFYIMNLIIVLPLIEKEKSEYIILVKNELKKKILNKIKFAIFDKEIEFNFIILMPFETNAKNKNLFLNQIKKEIFDNFNKIFKKYGIFYKIELQLIKIKFDRNKPIKIFKEMFKITKKLKQIEVQQKIDTKKLFIRIISFFILKNLNATLQSQNAINKMIFTHNFYVLKSILLLIKISSNFEFKTDDKFSKEKLKNCKKAIFDGNSTEKILKREILQKKMIEFFEMENKTKKSQKISDQILTAEFFNLVRIFVLPKKSLSKFDIKNSSKKYFYNLNKTAIKLALKRISRIDFDEKIFALVLKEKLPVEISESYTTLRNENLLLSFKKMLRENRSEFGMRLGAIYFKLMFGKMKQFCSNSFCRNFFEKGDFILFDKIGFIFDMKMPRENFNFAF